MAKIILPGIESFRGRDILLYETLKKMEAALNHVSTQTATNPNGPLDRPAAPERIQVSAADGIFDIAITDNANQGRGLNYFIEYSLEPGFSNPTTYFLGPARNMRMQLGSLVLYWRCYSQFLGSDPSPYLAFGNPTPVSGGGAIAGPTPNAGQGSGTGGSTGTGSTGGGQGYGPVGRGSRLANNVD